MEFSVKIENKDIFKKIKEFAEETGDMKPFLKVATRRIMNVIDENFETEGKNTGEKWEDWSDIWLKRRQEMGNADGKILNLGGYLRRSIERHIDSDRAVIGSPLKYAAIHNFGSTQDMKINMPKREFMRIDAVEEERILDDLNEYFVKKLHQKQI